MEYYVQIIDISRSWGYRLVYPREGHDIRSINMIRGAWIYSTDKLGFMFLSVRERSFITCH